MDQVQREAVVGLRRMGFEEVYRDEQRIIVRNAARDITETIPWDELGPVTVRAIRKRMQQQTANKRNAAAVKQRQQTERHLAAVRAPKHATKVYDIAEARRRREAAAEEAKYRNFKFYDRLMRSTPGQ